MTHAWTVKVQDGAPSAHFVSTSRHDLERKIVGTYYDPLTLRKDPEYRRLFDEELAERIERNGYTLVRVQLVEIDTVPPAPEVME